MKKLFAAEQFTPTKWDTAAQKAKFANHFVRFVEGGFKPTLFYDWFYKRLSNCFGHIAHYNRGGFYGTWFKTLPGRRDFLVNATKFPCYGDPTFTYSDVERALAAWIKQAGLIENYTKAIDVATETLERHELARLKAKYEKTEAADIPLAA